MLPDYSETLKLIKQAALDAVTASKPMTTCFGTVTSTSPLKISVDQKMTLGQKQLILTRNVTDFTATITINNNVENITIHNGLGVGDKVILTRMQGGQKFIIWDRLTT